MTFLGVNMACESHYQIFLSEQGFDFDGVELETGNDQVFGLFQVYRNELGDIFGRDEDPYLVVTKREVIESGINVTDLFREQLQLMISDINRPILEEPFDYAPMPEDELIEEEIIIIE